MYKVDSTDFKENRCSDVHWIEQPQETLHILHRDVFVKDERIIWRVASFLEQINEVVFVTTVDLGVQELGFGGINELTGNLSFT